MSDSISVAATPEELYALVSDVTRMGEWSPVCKACWWDDGAGPQLTRPYNSGVRIQSVEAVSAS